MKYAKKHTKRSRKPRYSLKKPFRKMSVYMPIQLTQKTVTNISDLAVDVEDLPATGSFYPQPGYPTVAPIDDWENTDNQFFSHALYFQLDQLSDVSRFINLFDKYRIKRVTCQLIPQFNVNQVIPTNVSQINNNATTAITYDFDDAVAIKSYEGLLSRQKIKITTGIRPWKYSIKPRIGIATNDGTIGQVQKSDQWLSTENSGTVAHYGIKFGHYYFNQLIPSSMGVSAEEYSYQLITTYVLEFKDIKDLFADQNIED